MGDFKPCAIAIDVPNIISKPALASETHRGHRSTISRIPSVVSQAIPAHARLGTVKSVINAITSRASSKKTREILQIKRSIPKAKTSRYHREEGGTHHQACVENSNLFPIYGVQLFSGGIARAQRGHLCMLGHCAVSFRAEASDRSVLSGAS